MFNGMGKGAYPFAAREAMYRSYNSAELLGARRLKLLLVHGSQLQEHVQFLFRDDIAVDDGRR